jgi:hypothetical protein
LLVLYFIDPSASIHNTTTKPTNKTSPRIMVVYAYAWLVKNNTLKFLIEFSSTAIRLHNSSQFSFMLVKVRKIEKISAKSNIKQVPTKLLFTKGNIGIFCQVLLF